MNILVIGGSYFYGRVFVMEAVRKHRVAVVNRGTYSMEEFGAVQVTGDRHNAAVFESLQEDYDAVVDFCAYEKGDVDTVVRNISGRIGQYILISTVDVYERGTGDLKTEEHALERRALGGEAGAYIAGKVAVEDEVRQSCGELGIPWTIFRPAILYGPYNYAPRESAYIQMMLTGHVLPLLADADGRFQFVYVKDAAGAVLRAAGSEKAFGQCYNLCQDEIVDYNRFFQALKRAADPEIRETLQDIQITVEEAVAKGIPVPFPATHQETELCSNEKGKRELHMEYLDFDEGMCRTYNAFKHVYA